MTLVKIERPKRRPASTFPIAKEPPMGNLAWGDETEGKDSSISKPGAKVRPANTKKKPRGEFGRLQLQGSMVSISFWDQKGNGG